MQCVMSKLAKHQLARRAFITRKQAFFQQEPFRRRLIPKKIGHFIFTWRIALYLSRRLLHSAHR